MATRPLPATPDVIGELFWPELAQPRRRVMSVGTDKYVESRRRIPVLRAGATR